MEARAGLQHRAGRAPRRLLAVLGGAAGHTYGQHAVWQFNDGVVGELGARGSWTEALEFPAGEQMRHLRELMESLPFTPGPDQSVLTSEAGSGGSTRQTRACRT